jgi:hypothetical protein
MFFANIFSYAQRKRLCAGAFRKTRHNLLARATELAPQLARHGIELRRDRLDDPGRHVEDAVVDPRPLRTDPGDATDVRRTAHDLGHALDTLERCLGRRVRHAH